MANPGDGQMIERHAVRAVIRRSDERILLMNVRNPADGHEFWITPGGGMDGGESLTACLKREVWEETGLQIAEPGPVLWKRNHLFRWDGRATLQHETYYLVETAAFEPTTIHNPEANELSSLMGFRWWSTQEIMDSSEEFAPRRLGKLMENLAADGPPAAPIHIGV